MDISEHEHVWLTHKGAEMMKRLGIFSGHFVVDFGCGVGRYTIPLSQAVGSNGSITAIERNTEDIQQLKTRISEFSTQAKITPMESSETSLDSILEHTVDSVLAFDVLQYITDWPSLFQSVYRVLKKSGSFHIYPASVPHPNAVDLQSLTQTMADSGFRLKKEARFNMMHNKHMVTDTVYTYEPSKRPRKK